MARTSSEQLIEKLIDYGYTESSLIGKPWAELNSLVAEHKATLESTVDDALDNVEVEEEELSEKQDAIPSRNSLEWTPYVLSLLHKSEKAGDDVPRTVGLRRIVPLLIGPIIDTKVRVVQAPCPENEKRATVVVSVVVKDLLLEEVIRSSDAADVYIGNTDDPYANHPSATAVTKAEGRALKRILNINCYTAEEIPDIKRDTLMPENVGGISQGQMIYLETMCRDNLALNVGKLIAKHYPNCHNIHELKYGDMLNLFKILASYQATGTPEELQGYDDGWKTDLKV